MNLGECYDALGGDLESVVGRLGSERLVRKFVLKFPGDDSFKLLHTSLDAGDYGEAFRAAHTIKGVCQNLGFDRLYRSSHSLTEALRGGFSPEVPKLLKQLDEDYNVTVEAISHLTGS